MTSAVSVLAAACARFVRTVMRPKLIIPLTAVCCFVTIAGFPLDASHATNKVPQWFGGITGNTKSLALRQAKENSVLPTQPGDFSDEGLKTERHGHSATYLGGGKVLLVGGDDLGTAEIYDTAVGTTYYTGSLSAARRHHAATKLADGRVLIAGGMGNDGGALASTEMYDPATGSFSAGGSLRRARSGHTATVLSDGRIALIGGDSQGSVEIFDPQTGHGELLTANLGGGPRAGHAAASLQDGRILIVGGTNGEAELNTAEVFDPATLTFVPSINTMRTARVRPTLRVLSDGTVQIIGGDKAGSMEMFNAAGRYFTAYALLLDDAAGRTKTLRANTHSGLFHKRTRDTLAVDAISAMLDRVDCSFTEIPNHIIIAGGISNNEDSLRSVVTLDASFATVTTNQTDYQPGEFVTITGGGWLPGENVSLTLHRDNDKPDTTLVAIADADGNINNSDYLVQAADLNVAFLLTASGQTSGFIAQTTFTDSVNPITITSPVSANPVTVTSLPATIPITFTYSTGSTGTTSAFVAIKDNTGTTVATSSTQNIATTTATTSATINVTIPAGTTNASDYSSFAQVTNAVTPGTITRQDTKINALIVNVAVPVKLAFISSPVTTIVGQCGSSASLPLTVQLQDAAGNKAQSTTNTILNLTSSSAGGAFFSDAQCTRALTTVVISNAGNSTGFYYKDSIAGTPAITAADATNGLGPATQTEMIAAAPSSCAALGFASTNFTVGALPLSVAVGDFNRDGKADVVSANQTSNNISILLGNGAGGFATATNFAITGFPHSVAIGDFNGDGKADVATTNQQPDTVSLLLGNGAGGFAPATSFFNVGTTTPYSIAVGDFNGDGKADVVTANFSGLNNISVMLGNGAGSLAPATHFTVGSTPQSVAIADFNTDGKADVVTANFGSANVSILLGNGAGGFVGVTNIAVGNTPVSVAVGDFNGDGKTDVATANSNANNVSVLLGNGAGGFAAAANFSVGTAPASVAIGDLNGDGKADITAANQSSNNISILLGNGVGGFASPVNFTAAGPRAVALGDFNADGKADVVAGIFANPSSVSVLLNSCISSPDLTIAKTHSGNLTIGTNANYTLTVSNAAGAAATSGPITITDTLPAGLSFVSGTGAGWNCAVSGQNVTCGNSTSLAAGATSSAITLTVLVGPGTPVGSNSITNTAHVSVSGENNTGDNGASDPATVNKGNQTITFAALADRTYGDADFGLSATASSGLAVDFTAGGNCTVTSSSVHLNGAGSCTIAATQGGDANYNAAPNLAQSFSINKGDSTTVLTVGDTIYDGQPHGASARVTGFGGLNQSVNITYLGRNANAYGPSTTPPSNAGDYSAIATFGGDADHNGSRDSHDYTIARANAVIEITPYSVAFDGNSHTANGTAVGVESPSPADLSSQLDLSGTAHTNAGSYPTDAWSFAGNSNYKSVSAIVSDQIGKASSTVTVSCPVSITYTGSTLTPCLGSVAGAGGLNQPVTLSYASNTDAGPATASVAYTGDANHDGSVGAGSFTIMKAASASIVTFEPGPYVYRGSAFTATALVMGPGGLNTPLEVAYTGDCTNVTTTNGCAAASTYAGDANHNASNDNQAITITKATASIVISDLIQAYNGTPRPATATTNPDDLGTVTVTYDGSPIPPTDAGSYSVVASLTNQNRQAADATGTLVIGRALLTVRADDKSKLYGQNNPTLTATINGFIAGENASVLSGTPALSTTATKASDVLTGGYPISVEQGSLSAANYDFQFARGTITINRAEQTINWSDPAAINYGTMLGATQLSATVTGAGPAAAGGASYVPAIGVVLHAGVHQSLTVNVAATNNYNAAAKTVYLDVQKAAPIITWNTPEAINSGTPLSTTQLSASAAHPTDGGPLSGTNVTGVFAYTPATGAILPEGDNPLSVVFTPANTADYTTAASSVIQHVGVTYNIRALYDQTKAAKSGSTIPIKLQLCSATGANLSSPSVIVAAISARLLSTNSWGEVADTGNANPDMNFRYTMFDPNTGGYVFNLQTKGLTTGVYQLGFVVGNDSTVYTVQFQIK